MKSTKGLAIACIIGVALFTDACKKDEVKSSAICYIASATETDTQGSTTDTFTYSSSNQLTGISILISGLGSAITETFTYDAQGRIATVVALGTTDTYTYDGNNHITQVSSVDSNGDNNEKVIYSYNSSGQLTLVQTYEYANSTPPLVLIQHDSYTYASTSTKNPLTIAHYIDLTGTGLTTTDTFEYDTHVSPVAYLNEPDATTNNVTKMTTTNTKGDVVNTTTYAYTYNSNDYPITIKMSSTGNSNGLDPQSSNTTYTYNCK